VPFSNVGEKSLGLSRPFAVKKTPRVSVAFSVALGELAEMKDV
jgi:hypothetical protein